MCAWCVHTRARAVFTPHQGFVACSPVMLQVLGYAAYTFVTAGFANFGPIFLLGLVRMQVLFLWRRLSCVCRGQDLFTTETSASLMFGAVVVVAGFFGALPWCCYILCFEAARFTHLLSTQGRLLGVRCWTNGSANSSKTFVTRIQTYASWLSCCVRRNANECGRRVDFRIDTRRMLPSVKLKKTIASFFLRPCSWHRLPLLASRFVCRVPSSTTSTLGCCVHLG